MNKGFGNYLKKFLEFNNISQSDFAVRLNITQKHMNEILNGKADITLEMAANIEKLTDIPIAFIIKSEYRKYVTLYLLDLFKTEEKIKEYMYEKFFVKELIERNWVDFLDKTDSIQLYMDIIKFLKVKDLEALNKLQEKTLFKKSGNDLNKLSLWIARADELSNSQQVNEYTKENFIFLIEDLKNIAYEESFRIEEIQKVLNTYGIYFMVEKALKGTKVRGCFKVKGKNPAIYVTKNYKGKDSFYFELFHELGHCKSDYNEAKSKVIFEGNDKQEERADNFALNTMINKDICEVIINNYKDDMEEYLLKISKENKIPMSFIVGRLAKMKKIKYSSYLYNKYNMI